MEEGSRLEGLEEEKGEEKLEVVVESNDGDEHVKLIQKIANEANSRDEDKNLELMASPSPNRLKNLIGNGKEGSSADHINSNAPPDQKDDQGEEVDCAKAKVGKVREENERLKALLVQAMKKYQSLKTHFLDILQQEEASKSKDVDDQEPEVLVSLSLGRNSITREDEPKKEEVIHSSNSSIFFKHKEEEDLKEHDHNLALTLDYCKPKPKGESHDEPGPNITEPVLPLDDCNLDEQETKEEVGEPCPPSTKYSLNKTLRSHEDDEVSQPTLAKKARVSVRARCDAPTINDGCQWRKYGQKIAKGNPCPRAYYRCTIAPACPVRKQVQRCAEDRSILITTYEGTHNHPLPVAATAMASTTSAAASMLTSASSNSSSLTFQTSSTTTTTSAYLHGLNFSNNISPSDHYNSRSSYLFHSSPNYSSIFSPSVPNNSHPTITLDLTATQPSPLLFSSSTSQSTYINNSSSSTFSIAPRTNFRFYSSEPNHHNNISLQPSFWGTNGYQNHHHHGFHRHKNDMNPIIDRPEQPLSTETIAAATKAIASDPSFRSALAAAITSTIVGTDTGAGSNVLGKNSSSTTPSGNIIGCASSLLNRSSSSSSSRPDQQGSFMLLPSSLSLSSPKHKAATSPTEH